MRSTCRPLILTAVLLMPLMQPHAASSQGPRDTSAATERLREPLGDPRPWIAQSEQRLRADSTDVDALRIGALALVTLGKAAGLDTKDAARDSVFRVAERWARRAAALRPADADVQFALAMAIGNAAMSKAPSERVRSADEIWQAATRATRLDPAHDGAWHVLGRWHAEMLRVSSFERFFAKQMLGGAIFDRATWDEAIEALERARGIDSTRIMHRLELAEIYMNRKRWNDARQELDAVRALPLAEANDTLYRRQGELLRRKLKGGR